MKSCFFFVLIIQFCFGGIILSEYNETYIATRTGFGNNTFHLIGNIVDISPQSACNEITGIDVRGKIVLVESAGCYPQDKAVNVQNAGGIAILIESYISVFGCMAYFTNKKDNSRISIPSLEISTNSFGSISNYLKKSANITATIFPGNLKLFIFQN